MTQLAERLTQVAEEYSPDKTPPPLAAYAGAGAVYVGGVGLAALLLRKRLPERIPFADIVLIGLATQRTSRLLAREKITAVLRAPFTEFQQAGDVSEVIERPRGKGARRTVGQLLTCPFCLSQWVASAFTLGFVRWPRGTRLVAATMTAVGVADVTQLGYSVLHHEADKRCASD